MRDDWKGPYQRRLAKVASARGKHAAQVRWEREKRKREHIAELDPIRVGGRVVERIVVIRDECRVKERSIYEFDRPCDIRRKRREVFT